MDIGEALLLDQLLCSLVRFVPDRSVQDDVGPIGACGFDLRWRRVLRHHHYRTDPVDRGGESDSLRMIAGGGANDATGAFVIAQKRELVQWPPELVGTTTLKEFRF